MPDKRFAPLLIRPYKRPQSHKSEHAYQLSRDAEAPLYDWRDVLLPILPLTRDLRRSPLRLGDLVRNRDRIPAPAVHGASHPAGAAPLKRREGQSDPTAIAPAVDPILSSHTLLVTPACVTLPAFGILLPADDALPSMGYVPLSVGKRLVIHRRCSVVHGRCLVDGG